MNVLTLENPIEQQDELKHIINSVVLAFSNDPIVRWMYPSASQYLSSFPDFIKSFGGTAFDSKTIYYPDNYAGAAFWFPPQIEPDFNAIIDIMQRTISAEYQTEVFSLLEQMSYFHPHKPHWYLAILGVEPSKQKKGYGSTLMKPILNLCDRHARLAYLESSNAANIPFYEQHGFEVIDKIQVGNSPTMFPMVRSPQRY